MWMGISEKATVEYRDEFELPGSDDIEEIREYVKRERAETKGAPGIQPVTRA